MNNSYTRNISLIIVLITIVMTGLVISKIANQSSIITKDAATGQTVVTGQGAPKDDRVISENNYEPSVLSDTKIFDLGMTINEYQSIVALMDIYTKKTYGAQKHITYSIDSSSITYNESMQLFAFTMRVKDSSTVLSATYQRNDNARVTFILQESGNELFTKTLTVER